MGDALAVFVQAWVDAADAEQDGVFAGGLVVFQALVVDAGYVQQAGADGDVLKAAAAVVAEHAAGAGEYLAAGAFASVDGGA